MEGMIPEPGLRAALVLRELYAGLTAERTARAYVLVTGGAENAANALIDSWIKGAYRAGYEKAREVQAQQEEAETKAFLEQARTVTRIVEVGTAREEAAQRRGEGEDHPGGALPVWCGRRPGLACHTPGECLAGACAYEGQG